MNSTAKPNETKAALQILMAVAETIRELGAVPSGHLYATLMGRMSLQEYESLVRILKNADLVSESAHELRWIGPKKEGHGQKVYTRD